MDYAEPRLVTPLDYLQAVEPPPMRVLILGAEGARAEVDAYYEELRRWVGEATESQLEGLIPAARSFIGPDDFETWDRLTMAYSDRGIPSFDALEALARELGSEAFLSDLAEHGPNA